MADEPLIEIDPKPADPTVPEPAKAEGTEPAPAPAADPSKEGEPAPATPPTPEGKPKGNWQQDRINTLYARLKEKERELAAVKAKGTEPNQQQELEAQVDELAQQKAREIAAQKEWNDRCNSVVEAGRKEFPDFNQQVDRLKGLVDFNDRAEAQRYVSLVEAALDTGEGHRLIHALGQDLDEAARLMRLSPTKMAVELTKMALKPVDPVSGVPKPITPLGSRGAPHTAVEPDDPERGDRLSTAEWMRRREAQIAARRQGNGRAQ